MTTEKELLMAAIKAAIKAGEEILEVYNTANFNVEFKSDNSPLTRADKLAHNTIIMHLKESEIPVLSEEGKNIDYSKRKNWDIFWLVDPLDGTKEFIKRNGEFTVNIALIKNKKPVMGVIFVPVKNELYFAAPEVGARKITVKSYAEDIFADVFTKADKLPFKLKKDKLRVIGSRSHMSEETLKYIETLKQDGTEVEVISAGSSLKLCWVAEGKADIYPRFAPTMEWDTAAGQAIVECAGFSVLEIDELTPLTYNKEVLTNPWFVAKN